jgi:acyl-homoserine lactone acylase PvdQ
MLAAWSGAAPAAVDGSPDPQAVADSAATALFNTWMHFFVERTIKDEFDAMSYDVWSIDENFLARTVYRLLTQPQTFVQDPATGQPIVCDNYADNGPDDSCTKEILASLVDAMNSLESPTGFGTADTTEWRWGKLHNLTITPLFPNKSLDLPAPGELPTGGFPKSGDNFVINRADMGWSDLDFSQYADGPAQRFLAEATPGQPITVKWALPGGTIFDSRDKHYRDLLDNYYIPGKHFDAPYSVAQILAAGESRMEFHP